MAVRGSIPPLKGGGHQHCRVQHNPVLPGLSHPHPKPSAYEASSQPVFLAAKTGRRKIVRGGKDRMLASRPQAVFISVRGPPPAWLFHEMSSFLRLELAAGGPWGQDVASSEARRDRAQCRSHGFGLAVMSAARPLFHRKLKSIRNLAMSQKCHKRL